MIFTLSQCPRVASAVGNLDLQQSECFKRSTGSLSDGHVYWPSRTFPSKERKASGP